MRLGNYIAYTKKIYQGHNYSTTHAMKEVGDLLWFIAEYCTVNNWELEEVMQLNINKLIARFPDGFEADRSLHRKEGDI